MGGSVNTHTQAIRYGFALVNEKNMKQSYNSRGKDTLCLRNTNALVAQQSGGVRPPATLGGVFVAAVAGGCILPVDSADWRRGLRRPEGVGGREPLRLCGQELLDVGHPEDGLQRLPLIL